MSEDYDKISEEFKSLFEKKKISSHMWCISKLFYEFESKNYTFSSLNNELKINKKNVKTDSVISIHKFKYEIMEKYDKWLSHYEENKVSKKINYYLSCIMFHTIVGEKRTNRDFWGELINNILCIVIGKTN